MKIVCSTSNSYSHLVPIFCYLFNRNWSSEQKVEIVGYEKPDFELPENFTFHSMGKQVGGAENFSTDLRKYFEQQDDFFIWMMEDTFVQLVNFEAIELLKSLIAPAVGRLNLCSRATMLQQHSTWERRSGYHIIQNTQTADYRLCTQPSIWNREFLLKYMTPGLTPWKFETQKAINDGYIILGVKETVVIHNEGVTKHDIYYLNLNGVPAEQIEEMEKLGILRANMKYERN